jgi:MFS transporter, DHA1 family, tetracycline resistance protein
MPPRRLITLLCVAMGANTVSIGAFPSLLPELGASVHLADWQLGAVAGAFGLARMLTDVPVGLFITHHLARALVLGPLVLLAGALLTGTSGTFAGLLVGRGLMGAGHTLATLAGLTAILRHHAGPGLASSLAALELSAMLGVLAGAALAAALPGAVDWNAVLLLACAPVLVTLALVPALRRALPRADAETVRPLFARSSGGGVPAAPAPRSSSDRVPSLAVLAAAAGGVIAIAYSTVDQFVIPVRGSREFGPDRGGIAQLLMLAQVVDILALLPLGALADRRGAQPVLGGVLLVFALALGLVAFGSLPLVAAGCLLFGLGMAGWTLPVGILRSVTPPAQVAWRTALYRVAVDGGMCLGPVLSGFLTGRHAGVLPAVMMLTSVATGVALLARRRSRVPAR